VSVTRKVVSAPFALNALKFQLRNSKNLKAKMCSSHAWRAIGVGGELPMPISRVFFLLYANIFN
jgi:hypothetical protein